MGTNYYLERDFCPCCGKPREKIHLGKSSYGWKFLFQRSYLIRDYDSFLQVIKTGNIYDEYGDKKSADYLINLIHKKQEDKDHIDCKNINGYDFIECDFC